MVDWCAPQIGDPACPGSILGRSYFVVFLGKTLNSHTHPLVFNLWLFFRHGRKIIRVYQSITSTPPGRYRRIYNVRSHPIDGLASIQERTRHVGPLGSNADPATKTAKFHRKRTHLIQNRILPSNVLELFPRSPSNFSLRNSEFHVPRVRTVKHGKHSLRFLGLSMWSKLDNRDKDETGLCSDSRQISEEGTSVGLSEATYAKGVTYITLEP